MVRITSSSMGRDLALLLLIALAGMTPLEALAEKDEAGRSREASPAKGEASEPAAREPGPEFEEITTPFGAIRRPASGSRPASRQAPAAQESPSSSDPPDSPRPPDPVEAGEPPSVPADAGPPQPEPASAPTASAGREPSKPPAAGQRVRFSCVGCVLSEFVRTVASELKLNYVLDPGVKGVANIHTYGELRRSDLMSVLETVLQVNGAAMVKTGAVYRILPGQNARQLPLEVRRDPGPSGSPAGESRVLQILPMNFVPAADMAELLNPYLSEGGDITYHQGANFLIITDTPANVGKLIELVRVFDSDVFGDKRVRVYALENSRATNLVTELESIFAGFALGEQSLVRFIPIPRLNSVLVIRPGTGGFEEVDQWVARLDQAGQNREIRNYFVKIQNGDAKEIAALLLKIYGTLGPSRGPSEDAFLPPDDVPAETPQAGDAGPLARPEEMIQGDIKIVADDQNNALIVQCSPQDYEVIEETIRELDRVPRQVLINVKIYEVELSDELSMGVSAFLQDRKNPMASSPSATTASYGGGGAVSAGLNLAAKVLTGDTRELVSFLNAQETRSRSRVLSAPSVIASDNVAAHIQVGSQIPVLTSQGVVPGGTGGGSLFSNTVSSRNTGVILNVTPRINAGGWVTLAVQQEVSSPGPPPTAGIQSPSINIRSVNTQVTIKNGQTIAIGGIISESKGVSRNRVPLLGRIPGVGLLFGSTSRTTSRTELIALITPHVIEDIEQASDLTDALKSTLKGLKKELRKAES